MENGGDIDVPLVHLQRQWEVLNLTAWPDGNCNHVLHAIYPMPSYLEKPIGESGSYEQEQLDDHVDFADTNDESLPSNEGDHITII